MAIAAVIFALVFALIFSGMPIGLAMALSGTLGFAWIVGWDPATHMLGQTILGSSMTYTLSVLPLFILKGNFVARSRLGSDLFDAAAAFTGHRRGGLARATIWTSAAFAAVCGSSAATCATMVRVALPAMRARNYDDKLSLGVIAAGGVLGILVPPSGLMLLYGIATQTSVPALFAGGVLPTFVAVIFLSITVQVWTAWQPELGRPGAKANWSERWRTLRATWGVILLFTAVLGGILGGAFTAAEGGGIGAFGAFLFACWRRVLNWKTFVEILVETGLTAATLFTIVFGAFVFANFVEVSGLPTMLGQFVESLNFRPSIIMFVIIVLYILLGIVLEEISMMLLTMPLFFPIAVHLGYSPVWFGIVLVIVVGLGMIHPPFGLNLFVIKAQVPSVTMRTLLIATTPFVVSLIALLIVLLLVPELVTALPRYLGL